MKNLRFFVADFILSHFDMLRACPEFTEGTGLAYNLGNFVRRLALPEGIKHWSLTSIQTRLIKIGGRLVRHARRLVFQLAEVMVSRDMFDEMLERIGRLRLVPG